MAGHFQKHCSEFDKAAFIADANNDFELLELKQRSNHITEMMIHYLPTEFSVAGKIVLSSLGTLLDDDLASGKVDTTGIAGWAAISKIYVRKSSPYLMLEIIFSQSTA